MANTATKRVHTRIIKQLRTPIRAADLKALRESKARSAFLKFPPTSSSIVAPPRRLVLPLHQLVEHGVIIDGGAKEHHTADNSRWIGIERRINHSWLLGGRLRCIGMSTRVGGVLAGKVPAVAGSALAGDRDWTGQGQGGKGEQEEERRSVYGDVGQRK